MVLMAYGGQAAEHYSSARVAARGCLRCKRPRQLYGGGAEDLQELSAVLKPLRSRMLSNQGRLETKVPLGAAANVKRLQRDCARALNYHV